MRDSTHVGTCHGIQSPVHRSTGYHALRELHTHSVQFTHARVCACRNAVEGSKQLCMRLKRISPEPYFSPLPTVLDSHLRTSLQL